MNRITLLVAATVSMFAGPVSAAETGGRPESMTLANFQFGPQNRWSFSRLREVVPTANIEHDGSRVLALERGADYVTDFSVSFLGREQAIGEIVENQYIDGLIVLKNGEIVFEQYFGHLAPGKPHLMNSVSKSVVALVAGKLAGEGLIDLSKPVSHYVPELAGSGWGPDSLQSVLDMRDGADYSEIYPDFTTTFRLQDCAIGWTDADYCPEDGPVGLHEFLPTIGRDESKLGKFSYRSGSTDVIGWVLEAVTGQPLAELISIHVWKPMGAEFDANITVDTGGFALADHGMSSTLRDLARVGLLMQNGGRAFGEQVVPADFVEDIFNQPGDATWPYGAAPGLEPFYRSFWWGYGNAERDINGYGIHGQFLRVAPEAGVVVALYSTWPRADGDGENDFWGMTDELVDAVVARFR